MSTIGSCGGSGRRSPRRRARSARQVADEALAAVAARDGGIQLLPAASSPTTHVTRPTRSMPRWRRGATPDRWPGCRWRSRTTCARGARRRRAARASSKGGGRPMTPPWWLACARPGPWRWARRTWTSSPWAARPRTRPLARHATRVTSARCPAAAAGGPPRPWRPGSRRSGSARIRAGPSASPPRCAAWWG